MKYFQTQLTRLFTCTTLALTTVSTKDGHHKQCNNLEPFTKMCPESPLPTVAIPYALSPDSCKLETHTS